MNSRRIHLLAAVLAVLGIGLDTALAREPSPIVEDIRKPTPVIEEIIVNGADEAAEYRASKARFEAEMEVFASTVHARYRDIVRSRLERSIHSASLDAPVIRG